jgi:lipopolysaccharide transport system ATP-binding protein
MNSSDNEVIIKVENVSRKFCRDFKKSLWYGLKDTAGDILYPKHKSKNLSLRSSEFWANQDISFEVKRGECLGLIGHNGAGKTTLLKMLNGLIKPTTGTIVVKGRIGALIALSAGFNPILTGRENIYVNGSILGLNRKQIDISIDDIIEFADIRESIDAPVRNYSSGMQVRLGFAIATVIQPDILLIDEVLAVGDNAFQKKCYERIYELKRKGVSIIVVSHNPYQLERLCERVAVLDLGRLVALTSGKNAILEYHKRLSSVSSKKHSQPAYQREGTGEVLLNELLVMRTDGTPAQPAHTGENVVLEFHCFSDKEQSGLRFRANILSDSNVSVINIGSNSISEDWKVKGHFVVRLQLPHLRLLTGAFSIDAYIVEITGKRIDTRIGIARLEVQTTNELCILQTGLNGIYFEEAIWNIQH